MIRMHSDTIRIRYIYVRLKADEVANLV